MTTPVSQLHAAIQQQRARLLAGDARLQATIIARWTEATNRLDDAVRALQAQITAEGAATPGEVFALDRWAELRRQMQQEIARLSGLTGQAVTTAQAQAAALALSDAQAQIQGALAIANGPGAAATFARLPVGAVEDVIGSMQAGSPLHALFASIATDAPGIAEREIATGLALGQGPQVVADAIARAINVSATRAMLIARTELNRAYRGAALAQYRQAAADGIGDSWVWSASLSASSCPACIFNSGRRFPVETPFESHPACRCTPIFEVKGLPPLIKEGSGEEYFNGLDPAQQDRILGSAAAGDAFRAGQVSLGDFVQYRENPVWGNSYQAGSLRSALANASGGRKAA